MIYDFRCNNCTHEYEVRRAMKDMNEPSICPKCRDEAPTRIIGTPTFKTCGGGHRSSNGGQKVII
jgi:putative FmdB family regulatory protein